MVVFRLVNCSGFELVNINADAPRLAKRITPLRVFSNTYATVAVAIAAIKEGIK